MSIDKGRNDLVLRIPIEELDLTVRLFISLRRANINTVFDFIQLLENGISFCQRRIGKNAILEGLNKVRLLGCLPNDKINDYYNELHKFHFTGKRGEMLDGNNMHFNQADFNSDMQNLGFSKNTLRLLWLSGLQNMDALLHLWNTEGVAGLNKRLNPRQNKSLPSLVGFYDVELIVWEIIIRLAMSGINVLEKISDTIDELIDKDAKYSTVRFWKSLKLLLTYLPDHKYSKLKADKFDRYANSYKYAVQYILDEMGEAVGEILPEEDYIEIICPECANSKSYFFRDLFNISCTVCEARDAALGNGFALLSVDECIEKGISIDDLDYVEDNSLAFVCVLCNKVSDTYNSSDSHLVEAAALQICRNCVGKQFLTWIADKSFNSVNFDRNSGLVKFSDHNRGETISIDINELTPQKLWTKIVYGGK